MTEGEQRAGREGSRWVNKRPTGEEVATWFEENVSVHPDLKASDYVAGVTLIQQTEKSKEVVGWLEDQSPVIEERENLILTPYVKVETRVKYFWDWMEAESAELVGAIEPVELTTPVPTLPPGFGRIDVKDASGSVAAFITCSMRVRIYEKASISQETVRDGRGVPHVVFKRKLVLDAPPATKAVPVLNRWGVDENAVMKAETGAVGRALALAGVLVVPGSGVASAEDMREALAAEAGAQGAPVAAPETAHIADEDAALRVRATELIGELTDADETKLKEFRLWARDEGLGQLSAATSPQLRGIIRRLERLVEEAKTGEPQPERPDPGDSSPNG